MQKLSAYVLTKNSSKYLATVLSKLSQIADELVIVDSGSSDDTANIVDKFPKARFIYRALDDFKSQRNFAAASCTYDWLLFVDADEILSDESLDAINQLKKDGFQFEAYAIKRNWFVLGQPVNSIYPVVSPDFPVRLFNKHTTSFKESSFLVHETPTGYLSKGVIPGCINHYTFETKAEIKQKLSYYTDLAAQDLHYRQRPLNYFKCLFSPFGAFIKYYFFKGGYRDGYVGIIAAKYAFNYTSLKYRKALAFTQR